MMGGVLCRLFKKTFSELLNLKKKKRVLSEETVYENPGKGYKYAEKMACKAPKIGISLASPKNSK